MISDKKYCPKCGKYHIMVRSDKYLEVIICLSFNCNWAGSRKELMDDKELFLFQRKNKLEKIKTVCDGGFV